MISRRNIRVKVMQCLYSLDHHLDHIDRIEAQKLAKKQFRQSHELFVYLLYFIVELGQFVEKHAHHKASKHLPTAADLNTNIKLAGNELLWKIIENPSYQSAVAEFKPGHLMDEELLRETFIKLSLTEDYKEYISIASREKKSERSIIEFIFTQVMLPDESFISHIEEHFINWEDDAEMMHILMLNFLQKPSSYNSKDFISADKLDFAITLLETTINKKEVFMDLLKPKLNNWDAERIAALDLIIIQMGICEFLFFETIPTKVTINEYIDLAKEYSTPQSGQFINGILDNIHKELTAEGKIEKKLFKK